MAVPFSENGGFGATTFFLFVPTQASDSGISTVSIFDVSSFNDPDDGTSYSWRVEDIITARVPTVRRVIFVYTDLGPAIVTVNLKGTNDNNAIVTASKTISIGTAGATGAQFTVFVDIELTAFRPQLSISSKAGAGPISIVSASMSGEVEQVTF